MPKPHIVQALCPERHCIMALAYEPGTEHRGMLSGLVESSLPGWLQDAFPAGLTPQNAPDLVASVIDDLIEQKVINPWCDLCRAPRDRWTFEDGVLAFDSLEEAKPFLRQSEADQARTRKILKGGSKN